MPQSMVLAKAELRELNAAFDQEVNRQRWTQVQFNPETLKVSFTNQLQTSSGAGDQRGTPARQFVGAGVTKLSVQLWFDVTAPLPSGQQTVDDVRRLTEKVAYYITPQPLPSDRSKFIPPAVRFLWGSFQFDGIAESLEESLEFFSADGKPLRASVSLAISQQKIQAFVFRPTAGSAPTGAGAVAPGTRPLTAAPAGATVQGLAASQGQGSNWKAIAEANGIENPRQLTPGQLLDLHPAGTGG